MSEKKRESKPVRGGNQEEERVIHLTGLRKEAASHRAMEGFELVFSCYFCHREGDSTTANLVLSEAEHKFSIRAMKLPVQRLVIARGDSGRPLITAGLCAECCMVVRAIQDLPMKNPEVGTPAS